jgi:hypothetical protein
LSAHEAALQILSLLPQESDKQSAPFLQEIPSLHLVTHMSPPQSVPDSSLFLILSAHEAALQILSLLPQESDKQSAPVLQEIPSLHLVTHMSPPQSVPVS